MGQVKIIKEHYIVTLVAEVNIRISILFCATAFSQIGRNETNKSNPSSDVLQRLTTDLDTTTIIS
jgi:hypothetical protein